MAVHLSLQQQQHQVLSSHLMHSKRSLIWAQKLKILRKHRTWYRHFTNIKCDFIYYLTKYIYYSMPQSMIHSHGWHGINFNSPFADMAILLVLIG